MITCPISKEVSDKLVEKYSFLKSITFDCIEKDNKSIYMDPTIEMETTPLPENFFNMKCEAYSLIKEETKKMPHLRNGWKIITNAK